MEEKLIQNKSQVLRVNEIFYSLQGEGARAGEPSIFIRLQGCSAKHACYSYGVSCDTEFESGKEMSLEEVFEYISYIEMRTVYGDKEPPPVADMKEVCQWIIFTGGEPADQLTPEILKFFRQKGYKIAIETSGIKPISMEMAGYLQHITVSPKVAEHVLVKNLGGLQLSNDGEIFFNVHELRYVRHTGQPGVPLTTLKAKYYYLSPHSDGDQINQENLKHCIKLCLENPQWRLSVQSHKLWKIL